MKVGKSIILIGEISSGKSTLARKLSDELKIPKASFGGYLVKYCVENNISEDKRNDLQNLGQEMIDYDAVGFLQKVIRHTTENPLQLIFEGVRHEVILKEIAAISNQYISIFIDATYEQRLQRYLSREKQIDDKKSETDFWIASSHRVEMEVKTLKEKCSLVINSSDSADTDFEKIMYSVNTWLKS